ncbi:MAG: rhomboid family intramembrane serine protease [Phycisphaeraceae bacterium]|nr:MAG: rhomboid family intramembrane serine protease [Phycisphaeraceae bacterium]
MGIYDRDYIRQDQDGGGARRGGGMRGIGRLGLTMVQILIIINVAVFLIDAISPVGFNVRVGDRFVEGYNPRGKNLVIEEEFRSPTEVQGARPMRGVRAQRIFDTDLRQVVGERHSTTMRPLEALGHFSTGKAFHELQVWRFVTFQFLHSHGFLLHLVFNMIGLYFFGPIVERFLGSRRLFLAYYLACGIAGAALYLLLNLIGAAIPDAGYLLLVNDIYTPLVGASAGVFGVLMAAAFIAGRETMLVFFVIPMRIDVGVYGFVALATWNLIFGGANAGGDAAHLGGAIAGFFLIRRPQLLIDFFDDFLFSGPAKRGRKGRPSFRSRHPSGKGRKGGERGPKSKEIDAVLDKVQRSGMQSLTDREREILRRASGDD